MFTLNCKGRLLVIDKPLVMGIINATPDSFFDDSRYNGVDEITAQAEKMLADGADIIDIGGENTRTGSELIFVEEEIKKVGAAIKNNVKKIPKPFIFIYTFFFEVV